MNPYHYAVVVGITRYVGGFGELVGPVNDAEAFRNWLVDSGQGGVPPGNVRVVSTPAGDPAMELVNGHPTKDAVDSALWEVTQRARDTVLKLPEEDQATAHARTRLYLYVAGHGIMPSSGEAALLTAKAQEGWLENLELRSYLEWYERDSTFAEVCIFADCCRTLEILARPGEPPFDKPSEIGTTVSLIGYATAAGKLAFEETSQEIPPDKRRGYFSKALIDGLQGGATTDPSSGYITSRTLAPHVSRLVTQLSADQYVNMPVNHDPFICFGPRRTQAVAVTAEVPQHGLASATPIDGPPGAGGVPVKVVIHFPDNFVATVELEIPGRRRLCWQPPDGPWTVNLYKGVYTIFRANSNYDAGGLANGGMFEVACKPEELPEGQLDVRL